MERHLTTAGQVIDALGGIDSVVALTGRGPTAVSNWRVSNKFPSSTYLLIGDGLRQLGVTAAVSLWGFDREPKVGKRQAEDVAGTPS